MKNQYFADRRDFFKYDLLLELMEAGSSLRRLLFVPMLTAPDGRTDGRLKTYPCGARRPDLYAFLQDCRSRGVCDITELRRFFADRTFQYVPFADDCYFRHESRDAYFAAIPDAALRGALVFLDPDNGLEVGSMGPANGHKYVRFAEMAGLLARGDESSLMLVYQHLPRRPRVPYLAARSAELQSKLAIPPPLCLADGQVAFLLLARTEDHLTPLREHLQRYATAHGLCLVGV